MGGYTQYSRVQFGFGGIVPQGIKLLLISNSVIFVIYFLCYHTGINSLLWVFHFLSLIPDWIVRGALWQPFTYLFLHSPTGFGHILVNMLMLWMFGSDLERDWGKRRFFHFYFVCGAGAGLLDVTARFAMGENTAGATIGASGAIYGVLLAFGLLYPNRTIYVFLMFPIPARIFVLIMGVIAFLSAVAGSGGGIAHYAHLGGMVFGYFYLRHRPRFLNVDWMESYRRWQMRRARRRFQVYMKKRNGSGDDWVN